jgi:hypothetical protein
MFGYSDDRNHQTPLYIILMKRLLTEGATSEMLKHCMTRFSLKAFIKQEEYMFNPASGQDVSVYSIIRCIYGQRLTP